MSFVHRFSAASISVALRDPVKFVFFRMLLINRLTYPVTRSNRWRLLNFLQSMTAARDGLATVRFVEITDFFKGFSS